MSDSGDYETEHFEESHDESRSNSISPTRAQSQSPTLEETRRGTSARARGRARPSRPIDDAAYYDRAGEYADGERENSDIRSAITTLGTASIPKLKPSDVASLKGLSGEAWNRKLAELVSTVKGESYSRAPAHGCLLIDSNGASALGGERGVSHIDPASQGSTSGSMFSANPPLFASAAKKQQHDELASNERLFAIARVSDGVVYGAKAYGNSGSKVVQQKDKVLDKFAMDAEEMRHTIAQLKKESAKLKVELQSVHRESDLLDAHLAAQNAALDEAALKKGYLRVGAPDKPRYEKVISNSNHPSTKLSLEEEYLTLQVQHKQLKSSKLKLQRQYDDLQDEVGSLRPNYEAEQELERETRQRILDELHTLQDQMLGEKNRHDRDQAAQDTRIAELRHEAGQLQAWLEVERKNLTSITLALQEQIDLKTAMQAKIQAIRKRLIKHGQP